MKYLPVRFSIDFELKSSGSSQNTHLEQRLSVWWLWLDESTVYSDAMSAFSEITYPASDTTLYTGSSELLGRFRRFIWEFIEFV